MTSGWNPTPAERRAFDERRSAYRRAMGRLAKGVAVVAARQGPWDVASPVTTLVSVSDDPATVLVSLHADARIAEAVEEAGGFAVSILAETQRAAAEWLATPGKPVAGLLDPVPFHRGEHTGAALLDGALAWLEARVTAVHDVATHRLVIGEVLGTGFPAEPAGPLVRFQGGYGLG